MTPLVTTCTRRRPSPFRAGAAAATTTLFVVLLMLAAPEAIQASGVANDAAAALERAREMTRMVAHNTGWRAVEVPQYADGAPPVLVNLRYGMNPDHALDVSLLGYEETSPEFRTADTDELPEAQGWRITLRVRF